MRKLFAVAIALCTVGCGGNWQGPSTSNNQIILNNTQNQVFSAGTPTLTVIFSALGASGAQTVTVYQQSAPQGSLFTATPSAGCAGVAGIFGTLSATTSPAPSSSFTVTAVSVAPSATCLFTITSSSPGPAATIVIDTASA